MTKQEQIQTLKDSIKLCDELLAEYKGGPGTITVTALRDNTLKNLQALEKAGD